MVVMMVVCPLCPLSLPCGLLLERLRVDPVLLKDLADGILDDRLQVGGIA